MDEIQAAFLSVKLKYLDTENKIRREIAKYYVENIKNKEIIFPLLGELNEESHTHHLFVIRTEHRDLLQKYLTANNVQTLIHYPIPPHQQECYHSWKNFSLPITEQIHREVLSLPISPVMTEEEVEKVVKLINAWKVK